MDDDRRFYGASIAIVSGLYSLALSSTWATMSGGGLLMALLGVVVLIHGVVLLAAPERVGSASGPLMVLWAVLMLLGQATMGAFGGRGGMMGPTGGTMGDAGGMYDGGGWLYGMGADPGMVALAALMLVSGLLMWTRAGEM